MEQNPSSSSPKGQCKRGFFVLRKCQKTAIAKCSLSGRNICEDCAMEIDGQMVCREVYAKQQQPNPAPELIDRELENWYYDDTDDDLETAIWYYHMRNSFYTRESYQPFDSQDYGSFDGGNEFGGGEFGGAGATGSWDDGSGSGSFFDS